MRLGADGVPDPRQPGATHQPDNRTLRNALLSVTPPKFDSCGRGWAPNTLEDQRNVVGLRWAVGTSLRLTGHAAFGFGTGPRLPTLEPLLHGPHAFGRVTVSTRQAEIVDAVGATAAQWPAVLQHPIIQR